MENETSTVYCVFSIDEDSFGHNYDVLVSIHKDEANARTVYDTLENGFIRELTVSE